MNKSVTIHKTLRYVSAPLLIISFLNGQQGLVYSHEFNSLRPAAVEERENPRSSSGSQKLLGPKHAPGEIIRSIDLFDRYHGKAVKAGANQVMEKFLLAGSVLEVGSGFGRLWHYARKKFKRNWTCLEWNKGLIGEAKKRGWGENIVACSILHTKFPNDNFNNVVALSSCNCVADLNKAVMEIARVLKPSGRFIDMLDLPSYDDYIDEELKRLLRETFKITVENIKIQDPEDIVYSWAFTLPPHAARMLKEKCQDTSLFDRDYIYAMLKELTRQVRRSKEPDYDAFFDIQIRFAIQKAGLKLVEQKEIWVADGHGGCRVRYTVAAKAGSAQPTTNSKARRITRPSRANSTNTFGAI